MKLKKKGETGKQRIKEMKEKIETKMKPQVGQNQRWGWEFGPHRGKSLLVEDAITNT